MYIGIGAVLYMDTRCEISFMIRLEKGYNQNMDICATTIYMLYMHTR